MENIPDTELAESIRSFASSLRKMEKAMVQMARNGANTTLVKKRLTAHQVGLAALEHRWFQKSYGYTPEEITEARIILRGLLPSLGSTLNKAKAGSPQQTLLKRRIRATQLALEAMGEAVQD